MERFWAKVQIGEPDECWLWQGAVHTGGYGCFRFGGVTRAAHRVAWELTHGPIPRGEGYHGFCIRHTCDVRKCVNPKHLAIGTHKENIQDRTRRGRGFLQRLLALVEESHPELLEEACLGRKQKRAYLLADRPETR